MSDKNIDIKQIEDELAKGEEEESVAKHLLLYLSCLPYPKGNMKNLKDAQDATKKLSEDIQNELTTKEEYNKYSYITTVEANSINGPAYAASGHYLIGKKDFHVSTKIEPKRDLEFCFLINVYGFYKEKTQ
ncbi:hypothetical protein M9Y10_028107 [Tritrichomonas musculus]|uniref:Uncharacterized protein n=1 Tax=Tritrichomonas musculus TaxID=1915356 RepID=A0ABR2KJ57_9EUKA